MASAAYTQAARFLQITTPAGRDVLMIEGMTGTEEVSSLYSFKLDLICSRDDADKVKPADLIGKPFTVAADVNSAEGKFRYFNGIVRRFVTEYFDGRFVYYTAEIVPRLWLLNLRSNSRIFQQKTVPEVLSKMLEGIPYRDEIQGNFEPRDYIVQYRETDFNFISRLMEEEGLFYFFEHTNGDHKLVLANSKSSIAACPLAESIKFEVDRNVSRPETIESIVEERRAIPGKYTIGDHNFQLPHQTIRPTEESSDPKADKQLEIYDYEADFADHFVEPQKNLGKVTPESERYVKLRMESLESERVLLLAESSVRALRPGYKFTLEEHKIFTGDFTVLSVTHRATQYPSYVSQDRQTAKFYSNSFNCIPAATRYVPERTTPKPTINGPQTAVVVGPAGEEIYVDEFARVKVQFFWDREGKKDANSSCWCRVMQTYAGKNWGSIWNPRIGQEVIVTFIDGDPDQPLIVGGVYNAEQMPPYKLPDYRTVTTRRSVTSPGSQGFNEIRYEDKKGKEQIFIHAERDMDMRVKATSRHTVSGTANREVGGDDIEKVFNDKHLKVEKKRYEEIGEDTSLHVKGNAKEQVDGNQGRRVKGNEIEKVDNNHHLTIGGDDSEKVEGNRSTNILMALKEKVGSDFSVSVVGDHHEKIGKNYAHESGMSIHIKAGMSVVIEAGAQITLKGPGGFVNIGPSGVAIQGTMVLINSGGAAGSGSGASPKAPDAPQLPPEIDDPKDATGADRGTKFAADATYAPKDKPPEEPAPAGGAS